MIECKNLSQKSSVIVLGIAFLFVLLNMNHTIHKAVLNVDMQVATSMNSILGNNPIFDQTLAWLSTRLGDAFIFICLSLLFFIHALRGRSDNETIKRLSYWLWLGILCLTTYLISCGTEFLVRRDTPLFSLHHFNNLQATYGIMLHSCPTSSFPSGHGLAYIFFAVMAWQRYFRISLILWCLAIVMLSVRLIVGLHWLSDILIGSLLLSILLMTLVHDTGLKDTYKFSEQAVSYIFGMLSGWRTRLREILIQ